MFLRAGFTATWKSYTACGFLSISRTYWAESNEPKMDCGSVPVFVLPARDNP